MINTLAPLAMLLTLAQSASKLPDHWRPFLDPLPAGAFGQWWLYLIPLSAFIAVVYKALRMKDLRGYPVAVAIMTAQIIAGMMLLTFASYLLVEVFVPWARS